MTTMTAVTAISAPKPSARAAKPKTITLSSVRFERAKAYLAAFIGLPSVLPGDWYL